MIACLKGELVFKSPEKVIVMTGGVGYEVFASGACLDSLPETGREVFLHIHTHVREDALLLYGFAEVEEKETFLLLLGVSGIGPRLAMSILSGITPGRFAAAIRNEDIGRLTKLSGVGKKTAERLCLELKEKVQWLPEQEEHRQRAPASPMDELGRDTVSVLVNLGYPQARAEEAVKKVLAGTPEPARWSLEDLIKQSLRQLA